MASRAYNTADLPLGTIFSVIANLPSKALDRLAEHIIDRLDRLQGDVDLEDDDPAGGNPDDTGELEEHRPEGFALPLPIYGVDQTDGPTNERQVCAAWRKHLMKA